MRLRSLVCGSVIFAAGSFGCSAADPGGFSGPGYGHGTGSNGGASGDAGSTGGGGPGGGNGGGAGSGGTDASLGVPPSSGTPDAGSGSTTDAGPKGSGSSDASSAPTPDANPPPSGFDQFQQRDLDDVNKYRATLNVPPLVLDPQLSTFALAGSQELSQDHTPHQHFINASNDGSIWTSGFNSSAAENQGDPNGWGQLATDPTQNELQQIDAIQQAMFDEGPGAGDAHGHYTNIMDPTSKRLGVGLLEIAGQLYLTNDFSQ